VIRGHITLIAPARSRSVPSVPGNDVSVRSPSPTQSIQLKTRVGVVDGGAHRPDGDLGKLRERKIDVLFQCAVRTDRDGVIDRLRLFFLAQRFMIQGMTAGSVKG
jgi:hypothetical protein